MKKRQILQFWFIFFHFFILFFSVKVWGQGGVGILQGLNQIVAQAPSHANFGLIVESMQTGKVLYEYRADSLFAPASVNKLFVAIPAMAYLTPNYRFVTRLISNGQVNNGVLNGDLFVRFDGDPTLTSVQLLSLFHDLKEKGINQIKGNIYIDNSAYDSIPYPPGWLWDDLIYRYAAPINAIILNENTFSLILMPATRLNQPAGLTTNLPSGVVSLQNDTETTMRSGFHCPLRIFSDIHNHYEIQGCLSKNPARQYRGLALRDPVSYASALIRKGLSDNHIQYQGSLTLKQAPANGTVLIVHDSPMLGLILKKMLKHSDNLITNAILKKIGAVYWSSMGTWQNGISAVKSILRPAGIDFSKVFLSDGSGLSRYNLTSPRQMAALLSYGYRNNGVRPTLFASLPIAGVDGTLAGRNPGEAKGQTIHAKTGSMAGVSALAGYVNTEHNGTVAFAVITNGFVGPRYAYHRFEDRICQFLAHAAPS